MTGRGEGGKREGRKKTWERQALRCTRQSKRNERQKREKRGTGREKLAKERKQKTEQRQEKGRGGVGWRHSTCLSLHVSVSEWLDGSSQTEASDYI